MNDLTLADARAERDALMKRCHTTADEVIAVAREKKVTPVAALIAEGFVDVVDVMLAFPLLFGCDVIVRPAYGKKVPA